MSGAPLRRRLPAVSLRHPRARGRPHRLSSFISQNWRGKPLISYPLIIDLIAATPTIQGLTVRSALDESIHEKRRTVSACGWMSTSPKLCDRSHTMGRAWIVHPSDVERASLVCDVSFAQGGL